MSLEVILNSTDLYIFGKTLQTVGNNCNNLKHLSFDHEDFNIQTSYPKMNEIATLTKLQELKFRNVQFEMLRDSFCQNNISKLVLNPVSGFEPSDLIMIGQMFRKIQFLIIKLKFNFDTIWHNDVWCSKELPKILEKIFETSTEISIIITHKQNQMCRISKVLKLSNQITKYQRLYHGVKCQCEHSIPYLIKRRKISTTHSTI